MRGLSIEEKAKAYEEALERAKGIHRFSSNIAEIKLMEQIFPELVESEDEKIRKELITHCRNTKCVTEEGAEIIAKWIAWLEKQGNKKTVEWSEKDESMYTRCIGILGKCYMKELPQKVEEELEWLKSLSERLK